MRRHSGMDAPSESASVCLVDATGKAIMDRTQSDGSTHNCKYN
jgi:hypothetical protein